MAQLAEVRCSRLMPRRLPQRPWSGATLGRSLELRSVAEDLLREMAFVYKATRSVRESMTRR